MKILYISPNWNNTVYTYYGLIPSGLKQIGCNISIVRYMPNINILNNYDVVIFGYRGFNNSLFGKKINTTAKMYNLLGKKRTYNEFINIT